MRLPIIWTIFRKEITEALRDWITLFVLIGVPVVAYPLIVWMTIEVQARQAAVESRQMANVAVWGLGATPLFDWLTPTNHRLKVERWKGIPTELRTELEAGRLQPPVRINSPPMPPKRPRGLSRISAATTEPEDAILLAAREVIATKQADAVLMVWPGFDEEIQRQSLGQVSVYYDSVIPDSAGAWTRLSTRLSEFRRHLVKERQRKRGLPDGFVTALEIRGDDVATSQRQFSNLLGQFLPMLLIMLSAVGATMAAVDMTAGEKDRATMQTLLCAPIRSLEIVAGKFVAVWAISLLSSAANVASLGFMIWGFAVAGNLHLIQIGTLAAIFALLLPATWTIAALFLAVATLARDAKDAGNFLAPLLLLVALPAGATLLPGAELNSWTSFAPIANLSLLIHALMQGEVTGHLIFLTLLSSLAYAGLSLALAARVFGREQVLLGGTFSWRWLLRGDTRRAARPSPGLVLTMFPLIMVGLFYASLALAQHGVLTTLLVTQYGVLLLPVLVLAAARKFPLLQTFSLRWPHWRSLLGSVLIGLTASLAIGGLVSHLFPAPDEMVRELLEVLQLGDKSTPLWVLWLVIALTPALCEETFFRGLMLSGLRRWRPWAAIGITALLFGLLHGSTYRLLPTFILGLVLGYAVWRSGSIYCSILIHALNNGLIATLARINDNKDWSVESVPWSLTLGAFAVMGIGAVLLTGPKFCSEADKARVD